MQNTNTSQSANILHKSINTSSFKLLRYFTIISLASILVTSITLGIWVKQIAVDYLTQSEEQNNIALARVLSNVVWPRYKDFIKSANQLSVEDLREHPKTLSLNSFIQNQVKGLNVIKIKIYNLDGLTVFSSDFNQIGVSKKLHSSFINALKGQVVSTLSFRDKIYEQKEIISNRNIIASYVPIKPNNSDSIEGVFEVYKDVTPTLKEINNTQNKVIIGIVGTLVILFFVLYFVVRHADKIIKQQNKKQQEETDQIRNVAIFDTLTGLPNRILFLERLKHALHVSQRNEKLIGLMFIDLDRFKQVNDNFGHDAGDQLLCEAADRLTKCVRTEDTVARISGDEFTIILENLNSIEVTINTAERIINEMAKPFLIGSHEVFITCSTGISIYPFESDDALSLVKKADAAMYYSKSAGRNNYSFYAPSMLQQGSQHYQLEKDLNNAIAESQFRIHFQPKINLADWKMQSMEALIRWEHPEHGLILPTEFIPILEETGKIIEVGEWVLRESCRLTKKYQDEGLPPLRVAVNVSALQLKQPDFFNKVTLILEETGLDAQYLELELTESCLIEDVGKNIELLHNLKSIGITLTIDDFGTGYSSLNYLSKLPIDTLKIDKSFVQDMMQNKQKRSIVSAIISFAHGLDMNIVAEGIENIGQLTFITAMRCTTAQGFLLSKPIPEEEFYTLLQSSDDFRHIIENIESN